jgi:DNA-binding NarL/FixJ family response regulator
MEAILNRQAVVIWPPHKRGQSLISFAESPAVAEAIYATVVEGMSREIRLKIDGIRLNCELHPLDLDPAVIFLRAAEMQLNGEDFSEEDIHVLRSLANDQTINEIGAAMSKSASAIDARIRKLKMRLGVTTLPGLAAKAIRARLI